MTSCFSTFVDDVMWSPVKQVGKGRYAHQGKSSKRGGGREVQQRGKGGKECYPSSIKTREVLGNPSPMPSRFPETRETSRGSREISRAEGGDFPIPPESWWSTDILSSSNFLQGVHQQILPCRQGRIDSVKINPSLLMMRECLDWTSSSVDNKSFSEARLSSLTSCFWVAFTRLP